MNFSEADSGQGHRIQGYDPGHIVVDGQTYRNGLIVSPGRIITGWGPASADQLGPEHIAPLVELAPQVVVIGTGRSQVFPNPEVYFAALALGLGLEVMDTGAACRTYNILMAEGREVAAGLILC